MVHIVYTDWFLFSILINIVFGILYFVCVLCSNNAAYQLLAILSSVASPRTVATVAATSTSIAAVILVLLYFTLWVELFCPFVYLWNGMSQFAFMHVHGAVFPR